MNRKGNVSSQKTECINKTKLVSPSSFHLLSYPHKQNPRISRPSKTEDSSPLSSKPILEKKAFESPF